MGKLAITGDAVRTTTFPVWPLGKEQEALALHDVLDSSKWGGQPFPGKYASTFAKKFAAVHTAEYGQCVNTGTVAIQAALKAIDIRPGDEVIVPAYTWEGTVGPVLLLNAVPVFVDIVPAYTWEGAGARVLFMSVVPGLVGIDPATCGLDAKQCEGAITPKTKAIL